MANSAPHSCVELVLPFPPSINRLWTRTRKGIRKTDIYTVWLMLAAVEARKQCRSKISGPYKITVQLVRPDKRKRDIDNFAFKAISDLLRLVGFINDDSDAELISARWVTTGPPCTVRVEPAGIE